MGMGMGMTMPFAGRHAMAVMQEPMMFAQPMYGGGYMQQQQPMGMRGMGMGMNMMQPAEPFFLRFQQQQQPMMGGGQGYGGQGYGGAMGGGYRY